MFVLIGGGGRTATRLARLLAGHGHEVRLIEHREDVLKRMHREVPTESVVVGRACDSDVLERAGIQRANVVAACTGSDADNLALCYLARQKYGVARTIARINNPFASWLYGDHFHVDVTLDPAETMSTMILEEMSLGDMMTLLKLRRGRYALVEEKIPPGATAAGMAVMDLAIPEDCVIAAVIRRGKIVVPKGSTVLQVGDEVLSVTDQAGAAALAELFSRPGTDPGTDDRHQ